MAAEAAEAAALPFQRWWGYMLRGLFQDLQRWGTRRTCAGVLLLLAVALFCSAVLPPEALAELRDLAWSARFVPPAVVGGWALGGVAAAARPGSALATARGWFASLPPGALPAAGMAVAWCVRAAHPTAAAALAGASFVTGALQVDAPQAAATLPPLPFPGHGPGPPDPTLSPLAPPPAVLAGSRDAASLLAIPALSWRIAEPPEPHGCAPPPGSLEDPEGRTIVPSRLAELNLRPALPHELGPDQQPYMWPSFAPYPHGPEDPATGPHPYPYPAEGGPPPFPPGYPEGAAAYPAGYPGGAPPPYPPLDAGGAPAYLPPYPDGVPAYPYPPAAAEGVQPPYPAGYPDGAPPPYLPYPGSTQPYPYQYPPPPPGDGEHWPDAPGAGSGGGSDDGDGDDGDTGSSCAGDAGPAAPAPAPDGAGPRAAAGGWRAWLGAGGR